jgi:hypothetical protein
VSLRRQRNGHGATLCRAGGVGWRREQGMSAAAGFGKALASLRWLAEEEAPTSRAGRRRRRERTEEAAATSRGGGDGNQEGFSGLVGCGGFVGHFSSTAQVFPAFGLELPQLHSFLCLFFYI